MASTSASPIPQAQLSAALATIFRGKLCDVLLQDRRATTFEKGQVIYEIGDANRVLFFIRSGFVKIGTVIEDGHELIYDVRGAGDVVGELCASDRPRPDRATALESAEVVAVAFDDVLEAVQQDRDRLRQLVQVFCVSLSDAYEQLNSMAFSNTVRRLVRVLLHLGKELGRPTPQGTEISTRLTQEEIAQMVGVSRERLSTAMNILRARGSISYSRGGHIVVNVLALEAWDERASNASSEPMPIRSSTLPL